MTGSLHRFHKLHGAIVAALLLLALPARADEWTRSDTAHEVAFAAVTAIDYAQTRRFLADGTDYEGNPLLGTHPSRAKLRTMVGAAVLAHAAVARVLPRPYRRFWQALWIGIETGTVAGNAMQAGGFRLAF